MLATKKRKETSTQLASSRNIYSFFLKRARENFLLSQEEVCLGFTPYRDKAWYFFIPLIFTLRTSDTLSTSFFTAAATLFMSAFLFISRE